MKRNILIASNMLTNNTVCVIDVNQVSGFTQGVRLKDMQTGKIRLDLPVGIEVYLSTGHVILIPVKYLKELSDRFENIDFS